jgi:hypothetical protein
LEIRNLTTGRTILSIYSIIIKLLNLSALSQGRYSAYFVLFSELARLDPTPFSGANPWQGILTALQPYAETEFFRQLAADIGTRAL